MNNDKELTIIGATGNLGIPVTLYLAQAGFKVTVIARNTAKAEQFFRQVSNIRIVQGDLEEPDSLKTALKDSSENKISPSKRATHLPFNSFENRLGIFLKLEFSC